MARIEQKLNIAVVSCGNRLAIHGDPLEVEAARSCLTALYDRLQRGMEVGPEEVDAAIRLAEAGAEELPEPSTAGGDAVASALSGEETAIRTRKRVIHSRSPGQARYVRALKQNELVFGLGPAGTGKTYMAVAMGVALLTAGRVDRLILSRPAVEAGERLGFLPGDMRDKVDPYMRPLYDALYDMLPAEHVTKRLERGEIEIAPLAFMRGRTLAHAFIILDEAQNTTPVQMKMFLTRLGEGARMVVTGDLSQVDLPRGTRSGLRDAIAILRDIEGVSMVEFTSADVVRHPLVTRVLNAYARLEAEQARQTSPSDPDGWAARLGSAQDRVQREGEG